MVHPGRWSLRRAVGLFARWQLACRVGLVAGLDVRSSNASPPTPIRRSGSIMSKISRSSK
jgi:hypothetical protein